MGNNQNKVSPLSIPLLVKQLNSYHLPEDRNGALETIEQIDIHLIDQSTFEAKSKQFKDCEGLYFIIRVVKKMVEDIDFISTLTQILDTIKRSVPLVMDFIRFGGVDVIEKALRIHAEDDYLAMMLPRLLNIILAIGANIAIEEIGNESLNLKLCLKCQEIILREKNPLAGDKIVLPKPTERVNKVIKLMQNYVNRPDVQIAALDAIINFSKNPDARLFTRETEIVVTINQIMGNYLKDIKVLWRGCMAYAILATITAEIAMDIEYTKIHEALIDNFFEYTVEPLFQQQILWLFAAFLQWPRCAIQVQKSAKCMEFFKSVMELKDLQMKNQEELQREKESDENKKKGMSKDGKAKFAFMAKYNKSTQEELKKAKERDAAIAAANLLIIPVQIRSFMRETGGEVYKAKKGKEKQQVFKQRKNFDERPKFGTVNTAIFTPGEPGLIPKPNEDEDGEEKKETPEWQTFLNQKSAKYKQKQ